MKPVFIETMLAVDGGIPLFQIHVERFLWGLYQHGFYDIDHLLRNLIQDKVFANVPSKGIFKIRCLITASDASPDIQVEVTPIHLETSFKMVGMYTQERKMSIRPWNAKTQQRDIYRNAHLFAQENGWDDALVLHGDGSIADASIYNVFLLKEGVLYTPPSSSMPVKGVMKEWLMRNSIFPIVERKLYPADVLSSDMLLLTNGVRGMQPARLESDSF